MWNYFTIKWLCDILKSKLIGYSIAEIFSQNKNEIILGFCKKDQQDFYWILNFEPSFPHMRFTDSYSRAKRNSVDLFSEIQDLAIQSIKMHKGERSFHFDLDNEFQIIFKLHGGRSNIIVKKTKVISLFRTNISIDKDFKIPEDQDYALPEYQVKTSKELKSIFPILDKSSITYLENVDFFNLNQNQQKEELGELLKKLQSRKIFLHKNKAQWKLEYIKPEQKAQVYTDLFSAINDYSSLESKARFVSQEKMRILKDFHSAKDKLIKSVDKMNNRLDQLVNNNEWEQLANLIMANLHIFKEGEKEAELYDFYNDRNIKVKVKRGITAQKYAESLYKKSKNKGIEIENIKNSISRNIKELSQLDSKIEEFSSLEEPKEIKSWINKEQPKNKAQQQKEESPFKEFKIKNFDIFVGRNAKNNDQLTTKFAKKDDLWMHAKDVSGSHLIIRKDKNTKVPTDVLEKAASIAAWYSKGKNDTLFPVMYTEKKYVRKGKGLAAGQVFVDKYDVLIVKPELP